MATHRTSYNTMQYRTDQENDTAPLIPSVENGSYHPQQQQTQSQQPVYAVYPSDYPAPNIVFQDGQQLVYPEGYPAPQVIYVQSAPLKEGPWNGHATAAFFLYILSAIGIWLCALPSIILSLQLVKKKVIPSQRRTAVIVYSVLELIAWVFVPSIAWYGTEECDPYNYCDYVWWGWIAIVIWWVFTIACGIPRIIYTYSARNNLPESS